MGSGMAGDFNLILQIPPTSPSRRDYGIRSPARSPGRIDFDISSSPQSPWRPREQVCSPGTSREVEAFRLYESNPPPLVLDRSSYYSGPLPAAPEGTEDRALPSFSGPLPGFATNTTESFEFATWARIYHRQHAHDRNSLPGSPEVGSSRESSFHEDKEGAYPVEDDTTERATSTFFLEAPSPAMEFSARAGMHGRVGSVSGELGRTDQVAKQKSLVARGYKSGEISGLEGAGYVVDDAVRQQRWESLNDAKMDISVSPDCDDEPMVTIPFKWEDAASGKAKSRTSSTKSKKSGAQIGAGIGDFSFGSSHTKSSVMPSETAESVYGSEASVSFASKPVKASPPPAKLGTKKAGVSSAVPFKWEDAPGKPKLEGTNKTSTEKTPALQLPPRLASASVKRTSWTTSTPSTRSNSRARPSKTQSQGSPDSTTSSRQSKAPKAKSSRQPSPQPSPRPSAPPSPRPLAPPSPRPSAPPSPRPSAPPSPRPSAPPSPTSSPRPSAPPLPQPSSQPSSQPWPQEVAQPRHTLGPNFLSGPLDNTAKPKGSSSTSKSGPISQSGFPQYQSADFFSVRSPTSTLHGPGSSSDGGHSHPSSENCSRKSASVAYSHSQSGTSAESLEHWSDPDHAFESRGHGHEFEPETAAMHQRLPWKAPSSSSSSSKSRPPMSPINPSKFDSPPEDSMDPPTRLPYKMPETCSNSLEIVVKKPDALPSRGLRSSSRCFELPRFRSKSNVVEEPSSWDEPSRCLEDGYRSPAYRATLELLSPSATPASTKSRSVKLGSASPRLFVEGLRNSVKHSLHIFSKRSSSSRKSKPIVNHDDPFMKRHPSLGL